MKQAPIPTTPRVLILSSAEMDENVATNDAFVANLNGRLKEDCQVEWCNYHDIGLEIAPGMLKAFIVSDDRSLNSFEAVYFKSYFRYHEQAESIAESLRFNNVTYIGSELQHYVPAYKLTQLARLSRGKVRIPFTIYLPIEHYVEKYEYLRSKLGDNFVFKAIDGSTGDDNYFVKNKDELAKIVSENQNKHFIAQAFIPNKSDLRILIVGSRVRLVIERSRKDNSTHLNNTSQGASATLIALPKLDRELKELALEAAQLMERDVAGVDIMLEEGTGVPFLLEVNASPQIASGAFEEEKLQLYTDFFKEITHKAPNLTVLGGTEFIDLPELGMESIPARVDTGARTSAIWASGVVEKNGVLEYVLFDKESRLYTGEVVRARNYGRRIVTNSTGNMEDRYTVKMSVLLKGRKINTTFTLADRSLQAYPILLGRNVLRGKFVVDVKLVKPPMKVYDQNRPNELGLTPKDLA
ncbi:MAG TPA: RimK/LysX family protein [Candidatus Saccharimonadales bacterium]|jgi:glutathione synthase/RimK-type ligase-like ATP-grasp enzyme|nr:RimK/LysX family protein [Candidatus Saccharimonadales bacterium]